MFSLAFSGEMGLLGASSVISMFDGADEVWPLFLFLKAREGGLGPAETMNASGVDTWRVSGA